MEPIGRSIYWKPLIVTPIWVSSMICFHVFLQLTKRRTALAGSRPQMGPIWRREAFIARRRRERGRNQCSATNPTPAGVKTVNWDDTRMYVCLLWLESMWVFRALFDVDLKYGRVSKKCHPCCGWTYSRCSSTKVCSRSGLRIWNEDQLQQCHQFHIWRGYP